MSIKKVYNILLIMIFISFCTIPLYSQTWFIGTKGWYTAWDSGILNWMEKDLAISFANNRLTFESNKDLGSGFLAGPLIGFQSPNTKWSFSFAPMILSDFTQSWDGLAGSMDLNGNANLSRMDFDFAVNYRLSNFFKLYAGYKLMISQLIFDLSYDSMGAQSFQYLVKLYAHIPTLGIGAILPLSDKFVLSGQAGVLYSIFSMTLENENGEVEDIWPHAGLGVSGEINMTFQPWRGVMFQLGYRYQMFTLPARAPGRLDKTLSYDFSYGVVATVLYAF